MDVAPGQGKHRLTDRHLGLRQRHKVDARAAQTLPEMVDILIAEYLEMLRWDEVGKIHRFRRYSSSVRSRDDHAIDWPGCSGTGPCHDQAARTVLRNLPTSLLRRLLSRDSVCAAESTCAEADPVSVEPRCTSEMLALTC